MASEDKLAHLESLLTQSESEISTLQFALKKMKKEYDQNTQNLTTKLRGYEERELEFSEFRKSTNQRNQEMDLLKSKNEKLEARINEILTSESQKISQTLSRNQALEKENLELHAMRGNMEEKIREISSQISHYRGLNEAHEKYQALTKKNISKLEEQLEKASGELNEARIKHMNDINLKNGEINLLRLKIEEYANNNKILKHQLDQKQDMIRELGTTAALEEIRHQPRIIEEPIAVPFSQNEFAERNNELKNLVDAYKVENGKITKKLEEAGHEIAELRKQLETRPVAFRDTQIESRKMQYEAENESSRRDSGESFGVPSFHKDRIAELSRKCLESEQRYHKVVEQNKRLEADLNRVQYEKNVKAAEVAKGQQDEAKDNFTLLISKLQLAINKNKLMNDENTQLRKDLEQKDKEIKRLGEEIERFISKVRTLTVESNTLRTRLRAMDPTYSTQPLSKEEIDNIKDEEIKGLREKVKTLNNELQNIAKTSVTSQALNQLKNDYEIITKELQARNEMIDSLSRQILILREANALTHIVATVEVDRQATDKSRSMHMEGEEDFSKQVNDLVQKRFEFENTKQKLEQENQGLRKEQKSLLKKVTDFETKVKGLESQNKDYLNQVNMLDKEKKIKTEAVANREKHLNELRAEQNRLLEERDQLVAKVSELEETREKYNEKIKFYEDYTNQVSKINSDIIADKEMYLKMILNQKNDVAQVEKQYQTDLDKVKKEREEFRAQFVKLNNERLDIVKQHNEAMLSSRVKLENQSIIIANSLRKVAQLEEVITELERQLNEYISSNVKDFEKSMPQLSDLSNILDKSRLTIEDYKNFEAVRELISQQKSKYEESVKFLENTIESLSQKYFALEESYLSDKKSAEEQIDKLKKESVETINRYENRLQEEKARVREARKTVAKTAQPEAEKEAGAAGMEVEGGAEEGAEDLLEREDMENDMENLRREVNNEKAKREQVERELEAQKDKINKNEDEKTRLRKRETELENEKANLSRKFTLREVSWVEQKKQYIRQMEEFREEEKERSNKLAELTDKVEQYESQIKQEKKEEIQDVEAKQKELASKLQKLEKENSELKKTLKEKEEEQGMEEEAEAEAEGEEEESEEVTQLKQEVEDLKLKISVLENVGPAEGQVKEETLEGEISEEETEMLQELKKAVDSGSMLDVLERAKSLLVVMSEKKDSA